MHFECPLTDCVLLSAWRVALGSSREGAGRALLGQLLAGCLVNLLQLRGALPHQPLAKVEPSGLVEARACALVHCVRRAADSARGEGLCQPLARAWSTYRACVECLELVLAHCD